MEEFNSFKKGSRLDWGTKEKLGNDEIQLGAILRIADATEAMSENYVKLQNDLAYCKGRMNYFKNKYEQEKRTNTTLKGWITRLKNKNK